MRDIVLAFLRVTGNSYVKIGALHVLLLVIYVPSWFVEALARLAGR